MMFCRVSDRILRRSLITKLFPKSLRVSSSVTYIQPRLIHTRNNDKGYSSVNDQTNASQSSTKTSLSPFKALFNQLIGKTVELWKKYGIIAIVTYVGLYFTQMASLFFLLDFDIINTSLIGYDQVETIDKVSIV